MKRIAIIDDEKDIVDLASFYVEREGFKVDKYYTGDSFLNAIGSKKYDCIVLDLMLPNVDGLTILKTLKSREDTKDIPVIILTAKNSEGDMVLGLEMGANDYIPKPFSPRVLAAKVKAFVREGKKTVIQAGDVTLDVANYLVYCKDKPVKLTPTEFRLLKILIEGKGKVFTREELLNEAFLHTVSPTERAVDVHIKSIRDKLHDCGKYIATVRGVGYKFQLEE
ncbi:response regulator transcription factor [Caldisericum sp.]|uniref:response regulator transcription factor n=1 Tax=Caldisericum sp. TaxID=2499687 RepID=UPI003D139890